MDTNQLTAPVKSRGRALLANLGKATRESAADTLLLKVNSALKALPDAVLDGILDRHELGEALEVIEPIIADEHLDYDPVQALPEGSPLRNFIDAAVLGNDYPQPELSMGAAIALFGTAAGRRFVGPTGLHANTYIVGLAESSSGKGASFELAMEVLERADDRILGPSDIKSGRSMIALMEEGPVKGCFIDEGGEKFGAIGNDNADKHTKEIATNLTSLYSASKSFLNGDAFANRKENKQKRVYNPCLSVFTISNQASYFAGITEASIVNGRIARNIIIQTKNENPSKNRRTPKPWLHASLIESVKDVRRAGSNCEIVFRREADSEIEGGPLTPNSAELGEDFPNEKLKPITVEFADERAQRFCDLIKEYERYEKRQDALKPFKALIGRKRENALKMATIRAIAEVPSAPKVTYDHLYWAYYIACASVGRLIRASESEIAETPEVLLRKQIAKFIADAGSNGRGKTEITKEFKHDKVIKHRPKDTLKDILDFLIECEDVYAQNEKPNGRTVARFYHPKHAHEIQDRAVTPEGGDG